MRFLFLLIFLAGTGLGTINMDVILRAGFDEVEERAQAVGFPLVALGFIGLSLRRSRPEKPNSQPPAPRRGRGADRS